jgi:hypothetical protein
MESTDLAWAAGFIDGEGCIGVYSNGSKSSTIVSLSVSQKYNRPLLKLISLFGGRLKSKSTPVGFMEWRLYGSKATNVLELIAPYLDTNKKEQAELAIKFQSTITERGFKVSTDVWEYRADLARQIKEWKRKNE